MDHHTIKRTRWLLEALAVAGAIIVVAYAAFSALVRAMPSTSVTAAVVITIVLLAGFGVVRLMTWRSTP